MVMTMRGSDVPLSVGLPSHVPTTTEDMDVSGAGGGAGAGSGSGGSLEPPESQPPTRTTHSSRDANNERDGGGIIASNWDENRRNRWRSEKTSSLTIPSNRPLQNHPQRGNAPLPSKRTAIVSKPPPTPGPMAPCPTRHFRHVPFPILLRSGAARTFQSSASAPGAGPPGSAPPPAKAPKQKAAGSPKGTGRVGSSTKCLSARTQHRCARVAEAPVLKRLQVLLVLPLGDRREEVGVLLRLGLHVLLADVRPERLKDDIVFLKGVDGLSERGG